LDQYFIKFREEDILFWLSEFSDSYSQHLSFPGHFLEYDSGIHKLINNSYWNLIKEVKTKMAQPNHNLNCFKIMAGMQIVILYFQPFESPIPFNGPSIKKGSRRINAEFAWNVALQIFDSFENMEDKDFGFLKTSSKYKKLKEDHLTICENLEFENEGSINFSNFFFLAQFWEVFGFWVSDLKE
jgi:hypothetical protein